MTPGCEGLHVPPHLPECPFSWLKGENVQEHTQASVTPTCSNQSHTPGVNQGQTPWGLLQASVGEICLKEGLPYHYSFHLQCMFVPLLYVLYVAYKRSFIIDRSEARRCSKGWMSWKTALTGFCSRTEIQWNSGASSFTIYTLYYVVVVGAFSQKSLYVVEFGAKFAVFSLYKMCLSVFQCYVSDWVSLTEIRSTNWKLTECKTIFAQTCHGFLSFLVCPCQLFNVQHDFLHRLKLSDCFLF